MSELSLTALIWPEDGSYVATCHELKVTTQGDSFEHALDMLKDAVELTLACMSPEELAAGLGPVPTVVPFEVRRPA